MVLAECFCTSQHFFNEFTEVLIVARRMSTHSIPDSTKLLTAKNGHRGLGLTVRRGGNGELGRGFNP